MKECFAPTVAHHSAHSLKQAQIDLTTIALLNILGFVTNNNAPQAQEPLMKHIDELRLVREQIAFNAKPFTVYSRDAAEEALKRGFLVDTEVTANGTVAYHLASELWFSEYRQHGGRCDYRRSL